MPPLNELDNFRALWNLEAESTIRLLEALPTDQYDFRPDPKGRSIGELAWHLSEIDACLSFGIAERRFRLEDEPPDLKRPREVKLLAPGYRRVHEQAVARLDRLGSEQLDEVVTFFDGRRLAIRGVLWGELLHHLIHHRGQLVLLCRMAGGAPPGLYGPNREEMQAMRTRMEAVKAQRPVSILTWRDGYESLRTRTADIGGVLEASARPRVVRRLALELAVSNYFYGSRHGAGNESGTARSVLRHDLLLLPGLVHIWP